MDDIALKSDFFSEYYTWKGPANKNFTDSEALMTEFISQSPCHALAVKDNCFSHNPSRAEQLLRRKWQPDVSRDYVDASRVLPLKVLAKWRNKKIFFFGDSTVGSIFASFVCFFNLVEYMEHKFVWDSGDNMINEFKQEKGCPDNVDCVLVAGEVRVPGYNITFRFQQSNGYSSKHTKYKFNVNMQEGFSIVIASFGHGVNNWKPYLQQLSEFKQDYESVAELDINKHTSWFWLEAVPQHYKSGNFDNTIGDGMKQPHQPDQLKLACYPAQDLSKFYVDDFRNRLAEMVLKELNSSGRMIRIAEPLYSQWDAHVDLGDSKRQVGDFVKDCSNFCIGSGVYRFIISQILTSIFRCDNGKCPLQIG